MSNCNSHRGSTPVLKPIQPSIQWVLQLFSSVKCPQHKADHLPLLGDEIRMHGAMYSCLHASLSSK